MHIIYKASVSDSGFPAKRARTRFTCFTSTKVPATRARRQSQKTAARLPAFVSIRQHTSAYVSIRQHTSAYVSIRRPSQRPIRID